VGRPHIYPEEFDGKPVSWSVEVTDRSARSLQTSASRINFTNHLRELGLVPSHGSTGDCYDNAAMETFWATLKRELSWIHGPLIYMSRSRLRSVLFDYIEIFYNRERAQAGLGHLSPLDYEASLVVA
jgi:transposase InsO family protein